MPITVSKEVLEGITAVRDSGATNMFARDVVADLCAQMGFFEASEWVQENQRLYAEGIFQGFQSTEEANACQGGKA